jgi:hypothetical protein
MAQDSDDWLYGGQWDFVSSSWIRKIRYRYDDRELDVGFKGGVVCTYNVSPSIARDMYEAPSMGQFVWAELYHLPYTIS